MILDTINNPEDLRKVAPEELPALAAELREEILDVVSRTGGHLASSLGVIELTIALHYAFDTPRDRIVWDVGHQAYAHKLLTGRRAQFPTLRQFGGLSGFPKREESRFDHFDVGHASTSISAALGMAAARDVKGEDYRVIAVIGDGSISAGLAFEGLNQAGHLKKKNLMVILNDNEMSISPNVGALSSYLNKLMTGQFYTKLRQEAKNFLQGIPRVGESMFNLAKKAEESLKGLVVPGMLFDELGVQYVGPIDGHRIDHLLETFRNLRNFPWPVLVHVVTKKGKGCEFAECDPSQYHGTPPFERASGKITKRSSVLSYTDVFGQTMLRLAGDNDKIIAISAAMSDGTGLDKFAEQFPNRFFDVGIAESHGITFACGLAVDGMHPVAAIYSTFMQRAYDQVVHDLCLQNLPVTLALDRAGIVGEDGPTHHGVFDIAYLRHIPNMVIMAPKDENELQHMIKTAVEHPGPTAVRYPRGAGFGVPMDQQLKTLEIGKAELLKDGSDLVIIAIGNLVHPSLEAAERLTADGISAAVVNARFAKPLDEELILQVAKKTGRVMTVEEHALMGGFGSAVLECLDENGPFSVRTHRIGLPDQFIEHGSQKILRQKYGLDADGIYASAKEFVTSTRLKAASPVSKVRAMDV